MMKKNFIAVSILSFALVSIGSAQGIVASVGGGDHYTASQAKKLAQEAHTPEQYKVLASYYGNQQQDYRQQAAAEMHEWVRRMQITVSLYAKYPSPSDSARNLYQYYVVKESEAAALAAKYSQLANSVGSATQQGM